ncbi:MAG: carboxypeptidase-like regulatory domain-containing protein, partial [Muribaculaceae bacterium]|nr:carboxypeptidase-like regulatory domain-containing protein [Muribaculaceae bacterium]
MKRLLSTLMVVCLIAMSAWASKTVNGRVVSASDNEPLIGATIQAVGTQQGTSTDINGEFTVTVNDDVKQLTVSCVGYKTQVVAVASFVNVVLEEDNALLDEVVVTAMGIKREKKALGYNTQNLKAEDLNTSGTTSLANAIQGKLTGVQVRQASGAP